jgi:hypothetical protein
MNDLFREVIKMSMGAVGYKPITLKIPRENSYFSVECRPPSDPKDKLLVLSAEDCIGRDVDSETLDMIQEHLQGALLKAYKHHMETQT